MNTKHISKQELEVLVKMLRADNRALESTVYKLTSALNSYRAAKSGVW